MKEKESTAALDIGEGDQILCIKPASSPSGTSLHLYCSH